MAPIFKRYKIVPDLPDTLKPLQTIAFNLWLTWNPEAIKLFIALDDDLWSKTKHNPVRMLGEVSQERLDEISQDEGFLMEMLRVSEQLEQYLNSIKSVNDSRHASIAYFSAEYGLNDTLPIYSGGLGILSGEHVKSASDLNLNFRGVGLLYQQGYFQQYLNQDGWQQDFYQTNDFHNMQVSEMKDKDGQNIEIELPLPGRKVVLKAWLIQVGRVSIYMLDSNIEKNNQYDRILTAQLYGGGKEMRLQQEMILGIGGVKLLEKLGIHVDVIHKNEGHSAFSAYEWAHTLMTKHGLSFQEAMEVTKKMSVFTTHTPVQAGHDDFSPDLIRRYFGDYVRELGISIDEFLAFGRINESNFGENFSMTVAAIKTSAYVNGVSKLHADVSKKMWKVLWRETPDEHIPIQAITNGIHIPSWISFEMNDLLERYLGNKWRERQDYLDAWDKVKNIPDPELWNVHEVRRRRLISIARQRLMTQLINRGASKLLVNESQEALNPDALTIGFARRFASYKRGYLIFEDMDRLLAILNNEKRPVQLIIAGKAHPQDQPGKELIKNIIHIISTYNLRKKIVFIEDYDINVARYMVQGVDIWLNTPLRPLEACGTSGMKAACNGVLNFSILDGWWDEAYDFKNGWAIGNRELYQDQAYQDEVESKALYTILENDIVPLFYTRSSDGLPREWIKMMKHSMCTISSNFNTNRMVKEYYYKFYKNAAQHYMTLSENNFKQARDYVDWRSRIRRSFYSLRIDAIGYDANRIYKIGEKMPISVDVWCGDNTPDDIKVDVYYGHMIGEDKLTDSGVANLSEVQKIADGKYRFSGDLVCEHTGNFGFKIRLTPFQPAIQDPYELGLIMWG
jgi:glycogen phosphorylase